MEGGSGWNGEVDGRGKWMKERWMEGGGGWKGEVDGRGKWMEKEGGWKDSDMPIDQMHTYGMVPRDQS